MAGLAIHGTNMRATNQLLLEFMFFSKTLNPYLELLSGEELMAIQTTGTTESLLLSCCQMDMEIKLTSKGLVVSL